LANLGTLGLALGFIVAGTAIPMAQLWRRRERLIRGAIAKRESQTRIEHDIPQLDQCVDRLVAEYGRDTFAREQLADPPPRGQERRHYVATLLQLTAERWQVTAPPINVSLVPLRDRTTTAGSFVSTKADWLLTVGHTGKVIDPRLAGWDIRIDPNYLDDDLGLTVIVAHEFAHGVLMRDRITLPGLGDDEVLTDVAAALCGFGGLMLSLQRRIVRGFRNRALT
jgi:hypothetical protein